MKIGLSSYSVYRAINAGEFDYAGAVKWAAANGAEHFEVVPAGFDFGANKEMIEKICTAAKESNIDLSSYTIGANFATAGDDSHDTTAAEVAQEIERVKKEVEIAAAFGVKLMRHDVAYRAKNKCTLEQFELDLPKVAEACGEVADYAAKYGITTSVENHGYHFQGSERVQRLVRAVNRKNYRTTLDVGNFCCADEDNVSAVMNNIGIASMVHFKDFYIRDFVPCMDGWFTSLHGKCLRGAITGNGDLNLAKITEIIKNSGYDGYISIEFEGMEECKEASRISMANVKALFGR